MKEPYAKEPKKRLYFSLQIAEVFQKSLEKKEEEVAKRQNGEEREQRFRPNNQDQHN